MPASEKLLIADRFLDAYRAAAGSSLAGQSRWDIVALFGPLLDGQRRGDIWPCGLPRLKQYARTVLV
ncbi:MAG: hypothetical protein M3071_09345 [Actinomycetota bacterium]|nr:hypothetical protein [Actinomycetota bacterium]